MYLVCKKGDGCFKILQKEIGEIQICAEIFQKKLLKSIFGSPKLHLGQKKLRKKNFKFFSFFIGGTLTILFLKKYP